MPMKLDCRKVRQGPPKSLQNGGQRAALETGPRAPPRPTAPRAMSMSQLHLFDDATRRQPDQARAAARRLELDAQSWVEHEPGWLSGHTALFGALRDGVEWHTERRAMRRCGHRGATSHRDDPRRRAEPARPRPRPRCAGTPVRAAVRERPARVVPGRPGQRRDARRPDRPAHRGHRRRDPLPRRAAALPAEAHRGRAFPAIRPRRRRPPRHGRRVPAHLAPRHPEGKVRRPARISIQFRERREYA